MRTSSILLVLGIAPGCTAATGPAETGAQADVAEKVGPAEKGDPTEKGDPAEKGERVEPREVAVEVPDFELSVVCELHGTVISTHRVDVSSAPASIRIQDDGKPERRTPLQRDALAPLWSVLASADFATFVDETPAEGVAHPGMRVCTLDLRSPSLTVNAKRWSSADQLGGPAANARQAMHTELGKLEKAKPVPVELDLDLGAFDLPSGVRRDWLEKDLKLFSRFASAHPFGSVDDVVRALDDKKDGCGPRKQGFGTEARVCTAAGGYSTCTVALVSHDGEVFEARASCRTSERSWEAVKPVIEKAHELTLAPRGFTREGHLATWDFADEAARARAEAAVAAELGGQSGAAVPPELEEALALLTSPRSNIVVGTYCGIGGAPPDGNQAMQKLVDAGRDDLLRDVLRGMNAAGRLYGYIGLRLLHRNTADDDTTFDEIVRLGLEVETCGGCMIDRQTAADIDLGQFERQHARGR